MFFSGIRKHTDQSLICLFSVFFVWCNCSKIVIKTLGRRLKLCFSEFYFLKVNVGIFYTRWRLLAEQWKCSFPLWHMCSHNRQMKICHCSREPSSHDCWHRTEQGHGAFRHNDELSSFMDVNTHIYSMSNPHTSWDTHSGKVPKLHIISARQCPQL